MKKLTLLIWLPLLAVFITAARADMGRIMTSGSAVKVEETSQKAIILANGKEEILILGTEIGASGKTSILRFIAFPSEPQVSAAPVDTFEQIKLVIEKYRLHFVTHWMTKGGDKVKTQGVEVTSASRIGSHDVTIIHVTDATAFRDWANGYFHAHGLRTARAYPREEAIVAGYVARGHTYFVLDRVDISKDTRLIEPLAFRFTNADLYYPLMTTNSFGGKGIIDLFVFAPTTLCRPGSNDPIEVFRGLDADQSANSAFKGKCMGLDVKASTSAMLVPEEDDLGPLVPDWKSFFAGQPIFVQAVRRVGDFRFGQDIHTALIGEPKALSAEVSETSGFPNIGELTLPAACKEEPVTGSCKGAFESYWFDSKSARCQSFIWGGCGAPPPFETLEACQKACVHE